MHCPACGSENQAGLKFCVNCGAKLLEPPGSAGGKELFCPSCGRKNPAGARFCEDCGNAIFAPESSVAAGHVSSAPAVRASRRFTWRWTLFGLGVVLLAAGAVYAIWKANSPALDEAPGLLPASAPSPMVTPTAPSFVCTPQTAYYYEDFEDAQIQNWSNDRQFLSLVEIAPAPDDAQNMVLAIKKPANAGGQVQGFAELDMPPFSNAYLSARFYVEGTLPEDNSSWFSFNWLIAPQPVSIEGRQVFDSRYQLPIGYNYFEMRRLQQPLTNISVDRSAFSPHSGRWYDLTIVTLDAYTEVRLNDVLAMDYRDSQPLPAGTLGLEVWLTDSNIRLFFDDIVLCNLDVSLTP